MIDKQDPIIPKIAGESTPLIKAANGDTTFDVEAPSVSSKEKPSPKTPERSEEMTPSWKEMMKKVTPFLYPEDTKHAMCILLALCLIVVSKIVNVLPPLAIRHAVDLMTANQVVDDDNVDFDVLHAQAVPIRNAILSYAGLQILSSFLSSGQSIAQRTVTLDAERRFSNAVFSHLQNLSLSYHLEKHIGEITQIMSRGSDSVSSLISAILFSLFPTFFETVVVMTVFIKLGIPLIAVVTFIAVVIYVFFTIFMTKTRIKFRREVNEASDALSLQETEALVNYETVTMFGRTDNEILAYSKLRQNYKNIREKLMYVFVGIQFFLKNIRLIGTTIGLLIGGWQTVYSHPRLSPGSFVVVQIYIDQLFTPLSTLAMTYRTLIQAFTDLEKVVTMLNRTPEIQDVPNAYAWKPPTDKDDDPSGEIVFENVSFYYKMNSRRRALGSSLADLAAKNKRSRFGGRGGFHGKGGRGAFLDYKKNNKDKSKSNELPQKAFVKSGITNTSFRIPAGKTAALVGPSGSGKTTIIRLMLRMYDPDSGTVSIDGHNVKNITQKSLRDNIGVVAQETVLFNSSLRDNIIYGKPDATEEEIWKAVHSAALSDFVNGLPDKLDTMVGERGMKLSGGERQRVGLARCVIKNPKLILLDEATSALDSGTEKTIQKNIAEICNSRTTLMIAHRLSTARYADEIIVLKKGEIYERGSHDDLISREDGVYAKMWSDQLQPTSESKEQSKQKEVIY